MAKAEKVVKLPTTETKGVVVPNFGGLVNVKAIEELDSDTSRMLDALRQGVSIIVNYVLGKRWQTALAAIAQVETEIIRAVCSLRQYEGTDLQAAAKRAQEEAVTEVLRGLLKAASADPAFVFNRIADLGITLGFFRTPEEKTPFPQLIDLPGTYPDHLGDPITNWRSRRLGWQVFARANWAQSQLLLNEIRDELVKCQKEKGDSFQGGAVPLVQLLKEETDGFAIITLGRRYDKNGKRWQPGGLLKIRRRGQKIHVQDGLWGIQRMAERLKESGAAFPVSAVLGDWEWAYHRVPTNQFLSIVRRAVGRK